MCQIYIKKNKIKENEDFIFYNHIFSRNKSKFTINELREELQKYNLILTREDIQKKVDRFVSFGLVDQNFQEYKIH